MVGEFKEFIARAYDPFQAHSPRYTLRVRVAPDCAFISEASYNRALRVCGCLGGFLDLSTTDKNARRFFSRVFVRNSLGLPVRSLNLWLAVG